MFSFGVMMYQLITGELPFGKLDDQNDLVRYQKRGKVGDWDRGRLLSVPGGSQWVNLITRCLVPDLKDRIRSANEAISMIPGGNVTSYAMPATPVENRVMSNPRSAGRILKVMQGKEYGKEYNLDELLRSSGRRLLTIGRDVSNTIVVEDYSESYMSRRHCTIENIGASYWQIRDGQWDAENFVWKNSMNGTYVNSDMVGQTGVLLNNGDIITIGDVKLKYGSK
jgi:serine/threonine protein kinase